MTCRKYLFLLCLSVILATLLCGCKESTPPVSEDEVLYQQLFDPANKIELNVRMSDEELAKMQGDFDKYKDSSPIYRMADLDVTITVPGGEPVKYTIEQVGVRPKGTSYSVFAFYSEEKGGLYRLLNLKISFQETFDKAEYYGQDVMQWDDPEAREARKNRTFATLEKLDLKWNATDDSTFVRESYCVEMFRHHGLLAPRTSLASVDWAGYHTGVYTMYEPIDKVFLNRNLPKEQQGGNLYKCAYQTRFDGKDSIGVENELAGLFYQFDLKTNKKTADHTQLNKLISVLNDDVPTKEELAEVVDMDYFLTFCAISYFLGNGDDMRNDTNNVYIYFRPTDGKMIIIPHDYNWGLGVGKDMTAEDPFGTTMLWLVEDQENPLFLYTVCRGGYYVREFADALNQVKTSEHLTTAAFDQRAKTAMALYKRLTKPSKEFINTKGKNLTFDLEKTAPVGQKNLSFADYVKAKLATWERYNSQVDDYTDYPFQLPTGYFLLCQPNSWKQSDAWEFGIDETGTPCFYVDVRGDFAFRVYRETADLTYGYLFIDPDSKALCKKDSDGNIVLSRGSYCIRFEKGKVIITQR